MYLCHSYIKSQSANCRTVMCTSYTRSAFTIGKMVHLAITVSDALNKLNEAQVVRTQGASMAGTLGHVSKRLGGCDSFSPG